jgi:hypothetical protein
MGQKVFSMAYRDWFGQHRFVIDVDVLSRDGSLF